MTDFLLELRSEEIPARMQARAREDLARLFAAELTKAGLAAGAAVTYATPRRLTLILRDLPDATEAVAEEVKGPRASAPPQALEGFLRKTGLTREQLTERDGVLYAVTEKPGRATADVLAEAIPAVIRAFPWPKSMRWGAASLSTESLRWVRPLQGVVALFGEQVVPVSIAGIDSGAATLGHRFHHPGAVTIGSAADYVEKLRACHVIVDQDERAAIIRDRATALAAEAGLELVEDEGLVAENAGLTEWPVPLLGRFDADFLSVPPEVIQLTARVNQKYFVCRDAGGKLANAFICTANIIAHDGGAKIVEGNRKVLAARLSDARFFYDTDLKVPLEEQAKKLDRIVFHEKLGTVADKVERVASLAMWLVDAGVVGTPDLADKAYRAAKLAKADLVTGMVGEFPELQGLMGGYYAAAQGEDEAVTNAIRDHYKPVGQGDDVPTAPVTVAVSLADKLETLGSFFFVGMPPTGSKDPYALRRAALGVIELIQVNGLRVCLTQPLAKSISSVAGVVVGNDLGDAINALVAARANAGEPMSRGEINALAAKMIEKATVGEDAELVERLGSMANERLINFFADRLKVQQREAGVRHDLIDAVFALGGEDDLVRLLARVRALQSFVTTDDGANLLAGYKRAANILKKEGITVAPAQAGAHVSGDQAASPEEADSGSRLRGNDGGLSYTPEKDEAALIAALDAAEPAAADAVAREDFEGAMAALATLRAPIDAFFDSVTVNDNDPQKREARLNLLARVRAAVHNVADFSRIEG
ncbi:glycine--tRNA ligase subunit beta [Sphingomonas endophytica]|uniref:Glycine--tRNA ligase beta subunit n=1 Tax=Sphingomonas endophytica TaxID=869719 RepID=A0A147I3X9_9SPHN|nr:glycine--tRNA ligase subunit beta [Sphingomonas endophytica]KTT72832.1 glycyl-tRNA synthetase subunit beta [Sphingomonas endophytica]